jgi:PTS system mannose-specific IID component
VFAALGAGIAMTGSLLGPLLFFVLFNLVRLLTRYYGVAYGYKKGVDIVGDMGGGFLQKLTEGASILGLFVMGALVNKWTHVNIPLVVSKITDQTGHTTVTTVQTILDQLMPGLVPLLLTFGCMWLLRRKVNALWIIVGFFAIGIFGYWIGLLGL